MLDLTGRIPKDRYRIAAMIGRGGMAEVYQAWDLRRQHHVAVRVMREDLAEDVDFLRQTLDDGHQARGAGSGQGEKPYAPKR